MSFIDYFCSKLGQITNVRLYPLCLESPAIASLYAKNNTVFLWVMPDGLIHIAPNEVYLVRDANIYKGSEK